MRIHCVWTLLLFRCINCHIPQAYSQLKTATIITNLGNRKYDLLSCQRCLLSQVGALRAKLTLRENGAEGSNALIEEFTVTATHSDFLILHPSCGARKPCGPMSITPSSFVNYDPNVVKHQVLARNNPSLNLYGKASKAEKRKPEIVCLVRTATSAKCRSCITQYSESAYLGEFYITSSIQHRKLALQIFSARVPVKDIVEFCYKAKACSSRAAQISGTTCEPLIGGSPLRDIPLNEDNDLYVPNSLEERESFQEAQAYLMSIPLKQHCFKIRFVQVPQLLYIMKRVAGENNGISVMLQSEIGSQHSHQYFSVLIPRDQSLDERTKRSTTIKSVGSNVCSKLNAEYFNTLPVTAQFPYWVSLSRKRAPQYGPIRHSTRCVLAYHASDAKACHSCVTSMATASTGSAAYSVTDLSPVSTLHFLKDGITETPVSKCSRRKVCKYLLFVPGFMCEYEFQRKKPFIGREQQATEKFSTESVDSNHERKGTMSQERYSTSESISSSSASDAFARAAKLLGNDIHSDSKMIKTSASRKALAGKSTGSTTRRRTLVSKFKNRCSERNVMLIQYESMDHRTCLQSLALEHDVLIFSLTGRYVWMICEAEEPLHGDGCKDLTIVLRLQRDVDVLRSLSAYSVEDHFPQKKTYRNEREIINSRKRSNTTPKQNNRAKRAKIVAQRKSSEEGIDVTSDDEDDEDYEDEDYTGRRGREEAISTFRKGDRKASRSGEDSPSTENSDSVGKDPLHFLHNVPKGKRTSMEYEWKE